MWNVKSAVVVSLFAGATTFWLPPAQTIVAPLITRGEIVADFQHRVDKYVALHRLVEKVLPPIVSPDSPAEVRRATSTQRDAIARGRTNAREGDIFTSAIGDYFKGLIATGCDRDFAALLDETREQIEPLGPARMNERWPGAMLTTMPPYLLTAFPPLPAEVEYRFVHHDLVLWDRHVDLIVDVLRNAIPADAGHNAR